MITNGLTLPGENTRPRGRPPGSKNKTPARQHTKFTIMDVEPGTQALLSIMASEAGLTMGEILKQAIAEYWAARAPTSNRKSDQKMDQIRRLMGIE
jgi:hypothetical protein